MSVDKENRWKLTKEKREAKRREQEEIVDGKGVERRRFIQLSLKFSVDKIENISRALQIRLLLKPF